VPIVLKSGSLNLLEPSGPLQACNGIALRLHLQDHILKISYTCQDQRVFWKSGIICTKLGHARSTASHPDYTLATRAMPLLNAPGSPLGHGFETCWQIPLNCFCGCRMTIETNLKRLRKRQKSKGVRSGEYSCLGDGVDLGSATKLQPVVEGMRGHIVMVHDPVRFLHSCAHVPRMESFKILHNDI
jgi:hypothetical protein